LANGLIFLDQESVLMKLLLRCFFFCFPCYPARQKPFFRLEKAICIKSRYAAADSSCTQMARKEKASDDFGGNFPFLIKKV
jgi:hypothetical protein